MAARQTGPDVSGLLAAHIQRGLPADPDAIAQKRAEERAAGARPEQEANAQELQARHQGLAGLTNDRARQNQEYLSGIQRNRDVQVSNQTADEQDFAKQMLNAIGLHGGLSRNYMSADDRRDMYLARDKAHLGEVNRVQNANAAADIADLTAMSTLRQEIIKARNAGNHTLADAKAQELAALEKRAEGAAKVGEAYLNHKTMAETNRLRAAEMRAARDARVEDRADARTAAQEQKNVQIVNAAEKAAADRYAKDNATMAGLAALGTDPHGSAKYESGLAAAKQAARDKAMKDLKMVPDAPAGGSPGIFAAADAILGRKH